MQLADTDTIIYNWL